MHQTLGKGREKGGRKVFRLRITGVRPIWSTHNPEPQLRERDDGGGGGDGGSASMVAKGWHTWFRLKLHQCMAKEQVERGREAA